MYRTANVEKMERQLFKIEDTVINYRRWRLEGAGQGDQSPLL